DFKTPTNIKTAAKQAIDDGYTKYTPSGGIKELKEASDAKRQEDNDLTYTNEKISHKQGAKFSIYELFQVLHEEGDQVIVPTPYLVSYPEHVKLAGGTPVLVEGKEENDFKITKEQLADAITPDTKAVIINSPSNPTGMMYSKEELALLGEVCLERD